MKKPIALMLGLAIAAFLFGGPELHHHARMSVNRPMATACRISDMPQHHGEPGFHHLEPPRPYEQARHACTLI